MPAVWSASVLKRLLVEPLTALVMAFCAPSPDGLLVLAVKFASLSWDSPAAGALQVEPGRYRRRGDRRRGDVPRERDAALVGFAVGGGHRHPGQCGP